MSDSSNYEDALNDAIDKAACEASLAYFIRYVFKHVYNLRWDNNWHHDRIIELLTNLELRKVANAVINMPPRYGKTEITTILWIAHTLIRNPKARFIHASYADDLVKKNSDMIRTILKHDAIQKHWQIKMRASEDSKGIWTTEQGGGLLAAATGGQITGFGAGITGWQAGDLFDGAIILDDPHKPSDAQSETMRGAVNSLISGTLHSRKNHSQVPIVIVMQRLHEDDASGYALSGNVMGDKFEHLKLPAISDDGQPLWHNKHTIEQLNLMQASQPMVFAGQYQQEPYVAGGSVFKLDSFPRYDRIVWGNYDKIVLSLDTAYKADQHNDPSCFLAFGCTRAHDDMIDCVNERMEYPQLRRKILEWVGKYKPSAVLIEDKASGQSLLQELRQETNIPVIAIKPQGDKITRAHTSTHYIDSQRIRLPKQANWLVDVEKQLVAFPNAKHDDIIDALSQFVNWRVTGTDDDYLAMMDRLYGKR